MVPIKKSEIADNNITTVLPLIKKYVIKNSVAMNFAVIAKIISISYLIGFHAPNK